MSVRPSYQPVNSSAATPEAEPCTLLIADDQPQILETLEFLLEPEGYTLVRARSPVEVLEALAGKKFDGLLIDLNYSRDTTSGREGLDLLLAIRKLDQHIPVVVMTAWGNVEVAVQAMRQGANDFIQKPWDNLRLITILSTQIDLYRTGCRARWLEAENRTLRVDAKPEFIANAPSMRPVLDLIERIGPSNANVLITGEHGAGKEVVAQTLHQLSHRASQTLVTVNTGALSEGTFESEIFGHVKGAFTDARADRIGRFELASRGTLFLDEIANIPLRQQAKLLRVLETGELERVGSSTTRKVDVRVLSATNADLPGEAAAGRFRPDLLYRLNTVVIHLPPLRERREDIPALAAHFLARYNGRYRRDVEGVEAAALQEMLEYRWPGNVRELDHTMERAVLLARGPLLGTVDLGLTTHHKSVNATAEALQELGLEQVQLMLVRKALTRFSGNVSQAAEALGLSRGALYRRMEKYGL